MSDEKRKGPGPDDSEPMEFLNREDDDYEDDYPLEEADDFDDEGEPPVAAPDPDVDDVDEPMTAAPAPPTSESDEYDDDREGAPPVTATRRSVRGRGNGNMSRVMVGAAVVIIAVALFIFWPRGGGLPVEDGDLTSVVTMPDTTAAAVAAPRSSDVDLEQELQDVVPEKPELGGTTPEGTRAALRQEADKRLEDGERKVADVAEATTPTAQGTAPTKQPAQTETTPPGDPSVQGKWVVQMGAFGTAANAAKVADDYSGKGFRCEVVSMPSGNGGTSYKVWIGYFETRAEATAYAAKHRDALGTATYITHR